MVNFLSGMLVAGYLVAAVFFLKFWMRSGDRLFVIFASAFFLLAAQRAALAMTSRVPAAAVYLYGLRLVAFLLIAGAILDKNRSRPRAA